MTNFLPLLIIGCFWCFGVFCAFSEGYALHFINRFLEFIGLPKWLAKPLYGCPPCMASIHGGIMAVILYDWTFIALAFVVCLCGLNYIVKSILFPEYE